MAGVFSIGDAVTFVNEKQDGKVVGFKPNNIIVVEIEDGFSFDVTASEIVLLKSSMNKAMGLADANSQKEIDKPKIDTFHPLPNFVKLIDESQIELIVIPEQGATLTGKIDFFIANPIAALFQGVMYEKSKNKLKKKTSFTVDQGGQLFIAQYTRDQLIAIDSFVVAFTLSHDDSYLSTHKEIQLNYPGLIQNFPSLVAPYCFATSHLIIKKNN